MGTPRRGTFRKNRRIEMQAYTFRGYLKEQTEKTQWDKKFVLCDVKDPTSVKWAQYVQFNLAVNTKIPEIASIENAGPDSLVEVEFAPFFKRGVGKTTGREYEITKLSALKVSVLERTAMPGASQDEGKEDEPSAADDEDLPF